MRQMLVTSDYISNMVRSGEFGEFHFFRLKDTKVNYFEKKKFKKIKIEENKKKLEKWNFSV